MQILQKLFFLLWGVVIFGQNGEEVFQFMNIPTSARQAALGGYTGSKYDADPNMALWNPGLLNMQMNNQAAITYTSYLTDINYGNFSYVHAFYDEVQFIALYARYMNYGDFDGYDEAAQSTGTFTAKEAAVTLGYGYEINEFFTVGTNVSYVNSRIENYTAGAILADVGFVFHDYDYYNTVGLAVRNFGYMLKPYDQVKEKLPFQVNLSYSWTPQDFPINFTLALHDLQNWKLADPVNRETGQETGFGREILSHTAMGVEFFPDKGFNIRLGYNLKRGSELAVQDARAFAGLCFGFGLRISKFKIDYSHVRYHNASNVNSFGFRINIDELLNSRY